MKPLLGLGFFLFLGTSAAPAAEVPDKGIPLTNASYPADVFPLPKPKALKHDHDTPEGEEKPGHTPPFRFTGSDGATAYEVWITGLDGQKEKIWSISRSIEDGYNGQAVGSYTLPPTVSKLVQEELAIEWYIQALEIDKNNKVIRSQKSPNYRLGNASATLHNPWNAPPMPYRFVSSSEPFELLPKDLKKLLGREAEKINAPPLTGYLVATDNSALAPYTREIWAQKRLHAPETDQDIIIPEKVSQAMAFVNYGDMLMLDKPGQHLLHVGEVRQGATPPFLISQIIAVDGSPPLLSYNLSSPKMSACDRETHDESKPCHTPLGPTAATPLPCTFPYAHITQGLTYVRSGTLLRLKAEDPPVPHLKDQEFPASLISQIHDGILDQRASGTKVIRTCEGPSCQKADGSWDDNAFSDIPQDGIILNGTNERRLFFFYAIDHVGNASMPRPLAIHILGPERDISISLRSNSNKFYVAAPTSKENGYIAVPPKQAFFIDIHGRLISTIRGSSYSLAYSIASHEENMDLPSPPRLPFNRFHGLEVEDNGDYRLKLYVCDPVGNSIEFAPLTLNVSKNPQAPQNKVHAPNNIINKENT